MYILYAVFYSSKTDISIYYNRIFFFFFNLSVGQTFGSSCISHVFVCMFFFSPLVLKLVYSLKCLQILLVVYHVSADRFCFAAGYHRSKWSLIWCTTSPPWLIWFHVSPSPHPCAGEGLGMFPRATWAPRTRSGSEVCPHCPDLAWQTPRRLCRGP